MEKFKTIHENKVLINPSNLDSQIENEKTNAIYRELIKQK